MRLTESNQFTFPGVDDAIVVEVGREVGEAKNTTAVFRALQVLDRRFLMRNNAPHGKRWVCDASRSRRNDGPGQELGSRLGAGCCFLLVE